MKKIYSLFICILIPFFINAQYSQLGSKLVGTGFVGFSYQGISLSLSSNGKILAIGGYGDNSSVGATWIYTFDGLNYVQSGTKLVGSGATVNSRQGFSLSFSSDSKTLAVGGPNDNNLIGATWIFTFNGSNYLQAGAKLVGTGKVGSFIEQGNSVSLSSDGKVLAVGAPSDNNSIGATWIFTFNGSNYEQAGAKLVGTGNTGLSRQGGSVSLSSNGKTLAVGAPSDNNNIGATWIFTFNGSNFGQAGYKLVGNNYKISTISGYTGVYQGESVSLSSDGNVLVVGGPYDNNNTGAVWIFTFNGSNYMQVGTKLMGNGSMGSFINQGNSVTLSSDGKVIAFSAPNDNNNLGAAWIFTINGSNYVQAGSKLIGTGYISSPSVAQSSVSLSSDGQVLALGGYMDNGAVGATWIFTNGGGILTSTDEVITNSITNNLLYPNPNSGNFYIKTFKSESYSILNLEGQVLEVGNLAVGVNNFQTKLKNGLYLIKIGNQVKKIMIK